MTNKALSHPLGAVADGTGVSVDSGIGVNVDSAPGVNVGVLAAAVDVGVLFAASCACTVNAAAVSMASGFCWPGVVDGRLQARMAPRITITAGIRIVFRMEFSS